MIMNIHSDASYFSNERTRSRTCGHFFMGWLPQDGAPIRINGEFHVSTNVIRFVVASAAKAELGAMFHNCQTGTIFRKASLRIWVMANQKLLCIVIMRQQSASRMATSNGNDRVRWKCVSFGLVTSVPKTCTHYTGILGKKESCQLPEQTSSGRTSD
jgi:hypothetical protein